MVEQTLVELLVVRLSQLAMIMMLLLTNMVSLLKLKFFIFLKIKIVVFFLTIVMCFQTGLERQPKWGHLKDLHRAIKLCEPALVSGEPTRMPLGNYQEVSTHTLSFFVISFLLWSTW
jgi:hypothetical protein